MDVAFILDKYFKGTRDVSIDVFDAQTLNTVYRDVVKDGTTSVIENGFWHGTLIYMEIGTGEEIDPNQVQKLITMSRLPACSVSAAVTAAMPMKPLTHANLRMKPGT